MKDATHFVIDLETMGQGPKAAIVSIGCVRIQRSQFAGEFYTLVDLESSLQWGLEMDAPTIQWWLGQSVEARSQLDRTLPQPGLIEALQTLSDFIWSGPTGAQLSTDSLVWGNGASFDNVILANAYTTCGLNLPWHFRHDRDLRTLLALYPEAKDVGAFEGTKHHALHDARHEAKQLIAALGMHYGSAWGSKA